MDNILDAEPDQEKSYCTKKVRNVIFYNSMRLKKNFDKNGVLWSETHMRIEMRLRCFLIVI